MNNQGSAGNVQITPINNPPQAGGSSSNMGTFIYPAPPDNLKIYGKIFAILKDGINVGKSGYNSFHKYHYTTEADVVEAIRQAFIKHKIIYNYHMESATQIEVASKNSKEDFTKTITRVQVRFNLIDVDSGQCLSQVVYGDGEDKGDKAIYKAITGAQKYFMLKTFMLSTGDDPENDADVPNEAKTKTATAPQGFKKPEIKAAAVVAKVVETVTTLAKDVTITENAAPPAPKAPAIKTGFNRAAFKPNAAPTTAAPSKPTTVVAQESKEDVDY